MVNMTLKVLVTSRVFEARPDVTESFREFGQLIQGESTREEAYVTHGRKSGSRVAGGQSVEFNQVTISPNQSKSADAGLGCLSPYGAYI